MLLITKQVKKRASLFVSLLLLLPLLSGPIVVGFFLLPSYAASEATPIQHVVYIMMENHSFDNIFGVYPNNASGIETPINLINTGGANIPSLNAIPPGTFNTTNPHEFVYSEDFDNGAMDGFAKYSGPQAMTYFTSAQLAIEWDWAEEYGLGDNYFSSVLSETTPNRLMSLAGFTPVSSDTRPPPYVPVNYTIFSQLSEHGVSWKVYGTYPSSYPMDFFTGLENYSNNFGGWDEFQQDLTNGNMPQFSYISSISGGGVDQHPPYNVTYGETWLSGIVNEVMGSPYWKSSVIFINYDEGGGYYDQVPPPVLDGTQLGFRVPLIVISPYSKEGYISHTEMNHDSILAFIEYNWHLSPLNSFVADSDIPLDFFDFSQSPRAPIVFSSSSTFPVQLQIPIDQLPYSRTGSSDTSLANLIGGTNTVTSLPATSTYASQSTSAPGSSSSTFSTSTTTNISTVTIEDLLSSPYFYLAIVVMMVALAAITGARKNKRGGR